ncbi:MAG: 3'-5' exonuclease, partial [bacterium]
DFWRSHFYDGFDPFIKFAIKEKKVNRDTFKHVMEKLLHHPEAEIRTDPANAEDWGLTGAMNKNRERFLEKIKDFVKRAETFKQDFFHKNFDKIDNTLHYLDVEGLQYGSITTQGRRTRLDKLYAKINEMIENASVYKFKVDDSIKKYEIDALTESLKNTGNDASALAPIEKALQDLQDITGCVEDFENDFFGQILILKKIFADTAPVNLVNRKMESNVRFFNDLLTRLKAALESSEDTQLARVIRSKYRAVLIDEFQDTDPVQYKIFSTLFLQGDRRFYMVGDPKQAVYSFRGADVFAYINAAESIKEDFSHTLNENYRSADKLVQAVNKIFTATEKPFVVDGISYAPVSPAADKKDFKKLEINGMDEAPMQFWFLKKEQAGGKLLVPKARSLFTNAVGTEISRLLDLAAKGKAVLGDRKLKPGDIAVLTRKHSEARQVRNKLSEIGIPCVIQSSGSLFETGEAMEILRILEAVMEPSSLRAVKGALATDIFNTPAEDFLKLEDDDNFIQAKLDDFHDYADLCRKNGFMPAFQEILRKNKVQTRLLAYPGGERRLTNILHLIELLQERAHRTKTGLSGVHTWLCDQIQNKRRENETHELRLESDDDAVTIMTVHKSKGLEFPIVFIPFSWGKRQERLEDNFFHEKNHAVLELVVDKKLCRNKSAAIVRTERNSEYARLAYVAMTRAKNRCYVMWGEINKNFKESIYHDLFCKTIKAVSGQSEFEIIQRLETDAPGGCIKVSQMPIEEVPVPYTTESRGAHELESRDFHGKITWDFRISSYSGLVRGQEHSDRVQDRDIVAEQNLLPYQEAAEENEADAQLDSEYGGKIIEATKDVLAPGPVTGNLFHAVFENVDFRDIGSEETETLIRDMVDRYFPRGENMHKRILSVVKKVLTTEIKAQNGSFCLSEIDKKDRINEIEFYYPVSLMEPGVLAGAFEACGITVPANLKTDFLKFEKFNGFMHGYMDMVFQYKKMFYLLDWKSNHLGDRYADYAKTHLEREMENHNYNLQYLIYSVGLNRYLSNCMTADDGYDYDKHFGGVIYVYLRGADPAIPWNGIFYVRPEKDLIRKLSERIK